MSGYTDDAIIDQGQLDKGIELLIKQYICQIYLYAAVGTRDAKRIVNLY